MALENHELLKNSGDLLKSIGNAIKPSSEGGKKITIKEWITIGTDFFTQLGVDIIDDDEE